MNSLRQFVYRLPLIRGLLRRLASLEQQVSSLHERLAVLETRVVTQSRAPESRDDTATDQSVANSIFLEGTEYSRYWLPLDYMPSQDYQPRWGYSRPSHAGLVQLFSHWGEDYRQIIRELRGLHTFLAAIRPDFSSETAPEPGWVGGPFTALDLALLYYFVYRFQPHTYLEIGSGVSTCFARRAIQDHRLPSRIVSIDPDPRASIDAICDEVIRYGLETVDLSIFRTLEAGDIVFMDGTHRSFMNSDVTVFMLDVLPLLKPGVVIHIHDILLPDDYPPSFKNWYWNEQYMLATYLLAASERIQVLMPSYFVAKQPSLRDCLQPPILALAENEEQFLLGGSLWFTHRLPSN